MSASDKKRLRKEEKLAALTEKQRKEKAEAKKLKAASITFIVIMAVVVLTAAVVMITNVVNNTGVIQKNTIAATTGNHKLNTVQMSYYYTDLINSTYSQWQSSYGENMELYLELMGLDPSKPLDQQLYDQTSGKTWADYFIDSALNNAKMDYALYDLAMEEGFTLSEDAQTQIDSTLSGMSIYAQLYGFRGPDAFLSASYCPGANRESYKEYLTVSALASAYYNDYVSGLSYDMDDIREYEKDKESNYSFFDYATYYVNAASYREGGTKDDEGTTVYSEAEKAAAIAKAKEVADELAKCESVVELDKAIKALEINAEKENAASSKSTDVRYTSISSVYRDWLAEDSRQENDITVIENKTTSTDANNNKIETISGYYVVVFQGRDDSMQPLSNVRHLLVKFKNGTTDKDGNTVYSDAEKAAAKEEAEKLLKTWKDGDATEDSFIALVKEHSDDGSAEIGGLFEEIHRHSGYVPNFLSWSVDEAREAGDTSVVESEYGYHVMYYVGDDELTYRDYMIREDLRSADANEWYNGIVESVSITKGNLSGLDTDLILSTAS